MGCSHLVASQRQTAGVFPFGISKLKHSFGPQLPTRRHCQCTLRVRRRPGVLNAGAQAPLGWARQAIHKPLLLSGLALAASGLLAATPPAFADLQTVPPDTALSAARPLPKQAVNKGFVWLLFGVGATGTFGFALFLENQERFFPAIVRANKALAAGRKAQEEREKREKLMEAIEAQMPPEDQLQDSVAAGLLEARVRSGVSAGPPSPSPSPSPVTDDNTQAEGGRLSPAAGPSQQGTDPKQETPEASSQGVETKPRGETSTGLFPGELRQDAEGVERGKGGEEGGEIRGQGKDAAAPNGKATLHSNGGDGGGAENAHGESEPERSKVGVGSSGGEVGLDEWMRLRSQRQEKSPSS